MKLCSFIQSFLPFFNLLGQCSCHSFIVGQQRHRSTSLKTFSWLMKRIAFIPSTILILLNVVITSLAIRILHESNDFEPAHYLIFTIFLISLSLSNFSVAIQSIFRLDQFHALFSQLIIVEHLLEDRLTLVYCTLGRNFWLKSSYIILSFGCAIFVGTILTNCDESDYCTYVLIGVMHVAIIQMIFYIDIFQWLVQYLVKCIEKQASDIPSIEMATKLRCVNAKQLREECEFMKLAHYHLWKSVRIIDDLFGWQLTLYFQQSLIGAVYACYFTFIFIMLPDGYSECLRKFLFSFIIRFCRRVCLKWLCIGLKMVDKSHKKQFLSRQTFSI